MPMFISTNSLFTIPRNSVVNLQKQISIAESELSSNELADPAATLGSQYGLDLSLQAQSANLSSIQNSNTIVQSQVTASQNALTSVASDAQTFINSLISAQSSGTVTTLPAQAMSLLSSMTSQLNQAAGGVYLFGGTNSSVKPVSDYSQGPQAATAAAFQAAFGMSQSNPQVNTISPTAMQAFLTGPYANLFTGASWTTNWSQASSTRTTALISPSETVTTSVTANETPIQQLANAYTSIADLALGNLNASTQKTVLSNALSQASAAIQGITGLQSTLGISQTQITNANSQMTTQASLIDNWVTQLGGVNTYQVTTNLSNLTTQLETAYSLTNRISKLGLVNYLST